MSETLRIVQQTSMQGASNWLSVIPLAEHGFNLNKREFRDALSLRFNRSLRGLPSHCPCGQKFDVNHAMNCKRGGFIIMRHNDIRDFEANLLRKVCNDVEIEPRLQPVTGEELATGAISGEEARLDVRAKGFWRRAQDNYFDVRVTNANSESAKNISVEKVLLKHEREKKRCYNDRIMNIEHGTLTPLVFTIYGGVSTECSTFHTHLADKIAEKTSEQYDKVLSFIRCKLSFIVLRSALLCLRGSRTLSNKKLTAITDDFGLCCDEIKL